MSVPDFVWRCLHDPEDGYYSHHVKLGAEGDFLTAPKVSQMFGEIIALWVVNAYQTLGAPKRFYLCEIGGGDGTLMQDLLRTLKRFSPIFEALDICLIEPSKKLQDIQKKAIASFIKAPQIVDTLAQLPSDAPLLVIANEVLDCLPSRQIVRTENGFAERQIGVQDDQLVFGLMPLEQGFAAALPLEVGQIYEISTAQQSFAEQLSLAIKAATGAAILIDYGHDGPMIGDTLQAVKSHQKQSPLELPGHADLTQWADFDAASKVAQSCGLWVSDIVLQGAFLQSWGLIERAQNLAALNPEKTQSLQAQVERLCAPNQMGTLFKVLQLAYPSPLDTV